MSISDISLLVVAALLVLYRAGAGWRHGASMEIRHLLVNGFGVLVAVRYWQPWTDTISGGLTFDPRWVALSAFVLLYAVAATVASMVVRLNAQAYRSVKSDYVNQGLGLVAGVASGGLLAAGMLWLAMVAVPGKFDSLPAAREVAAVPRDLVRFIETNVAGVAAGSTGRTKYPQVTLVEVPVEESTTVTPSGAVLMRQRGRITWQ